MIQIGGYDMSIKCGAHNCVHNDNEGNCYANIVNVRGAHSTVTDETLCKSFVDQGIAGDAEFAAEFNGSSKKATVDDIKCSACYCKHNDKNRCYADAIKINNDTASCDTFEC